MQRLTHREAPPANLLISGARLFDGGSGLEGVQLDVRVVEGAIAEIGSDLEADGAETIDAAGLTMTPGLIDPHVHLRTPGDEDEEDIASGTRAAAAGGFVAILAMPNTDPVVDSAAVLSGLIERAGEQAAVPTGFFAAISRGLEGRELVDMAELAARGAAGFSDDGRPVERAGMLRRALQYSRVTGLKLTLHEEDMTLTAGSQMHEGAVSAELGLHGYPGIGESVMVGRDLQIARYEHAPLHLCHISAAESVAEIRRAKELGVEVTAEVSPHHLCLTDELVRDLDPAVSKMNPPLRSAADRAALIEALADGTLDCIATDHAPHRTHEKEVPFEAAPNGVIGLETAFAAVYTELVAPGLVSLSTVIERMSAGPARAFDLPVPALRTGAPPTSRSGICPRAGWSRRRTPPARATAHSPGARCRAAARSRSQPAPSPTGWPRWHGDRPAGARGRHGARGRGLRWNRYRGRRAGVHHVHDRLPGDRHRPVVRRPDDHLHAADDRQLRGGGRCVGVGPAAGAGGDRARGPKRRAGGARGLLRLAGRPRCDRHPGAGHAHADAAPARRRHRARGRLLGWNAGAASCWR